ncbi:MAG TPA: glucose-6-phosphate dehydrogenase assembly protein OpcA [Streptosporangiaceae bacterium]|nr:glucose-6-phosphate dehydrogenase assembly protein OpcA [Streptosporangiaceae bacterium]
MKVELIDTSASTVRNELMRMSQQMGGLTNGVVLNLIIMTDEADQYDAMRAATHAGREHPCQVIGIIAKDGHRPRRLDAEVTVGENMPGQMALLRIHGELNEHVDSVVTPLLVPDTPVVVWWPGKAPDAPAADALGMLGQRRITDAAATAAPHHRLLHLAAAYRPGDTDLAWARTTNWRSLLAATLDRPYAEMLEATVGAEADNPSADLIVAWLTGRLGVPVHREISAGPGVTEVSFMTANGKIVISRADGRNATLSRPGEPDRFVALHRRDIAELLAEELRRLDPDEVYGETLAVLAADEQAAATHAPNAADKE